MGKFRYSKDEFDNAIVATVRNEMTTYVVVGILEEKQLIVENHIKYNNIIFTFFLLILLDNILLEQKYCKVQIGEKLCKEHEI